MKIIAMTICSSDLHLPNNTMLDSRDILDHEFMSLVEDVDDKREEYSVYHTTKYAFK